MQLSLFFIAFIVFLSGMCFFSLQSKRSKKINKSREKMERAGRRHKVLASGKPDDEKREKPN